MNAFTESNKGRNIGNKIMGKFILKLKQNMRNVRHGLSQVRRILGMFKRHFLVSKSESIEKRLMVLEGKIDELYVKQIVDRRNNELTTGVAYKNFENEMRGSREEIIERLKIYHAVIQRVKEKNGTRINALDLGCGRGEWLELLQNEYKIYALGVDSDKSMLTDCEKKELNTVCGDLVQFIKNAASDSVDIISMFQVVEHLPVGVLNQVLYECHRVLRNGGVLILETPNPENLIVGACNFYFDPTHVTKLPPMLLKILVEGSGFCNPEILRMHKYGAIDIDMDGDTDTKATKQIASYFNNYADYAVIAYKETVI